MSERGRHQGTTRSATVPGMARRGLLCGLTAGSAALLLAPPTEAAGNAAPDEPRAEADPTRIGFRASEHTRWFYRRARW